MSGEKNDRVVRVERAAVESAETGKSSENVIHFYTAGDRSVAAIGWMREKDAKEMTSYLAQQLNTPLFQLFKTCEVLKREIPTGDGAVELLKLIQAAVKAVI